MTDIVSYVCPVCGETITEPFNEKIARAELDQDFPEDHGLPIVATETETENGEELVHVCVSCYKRIAEDLGVKVDRTLQ